DCPPFDDSLEWFGIELTLRSSPARRSNSSTKNHFPEFWVFALCQTLLFPTDKICKPFLRTAEIWQLHPRLKGQPDQTLRAGPATSGWHSDIQEVRKRRSLQRYTSPSRRCPCPRRPSAQTALFPRRWGGGFPGSCTQRRLRARSARRDSKAQTLADRKSVV